MASFISGQDYLDIATSYANVRANMLSTRDDLFDAVYTIVMLNEVLPSVDLLRESYDSYKVNTNIFTSPQTLLQFVRRINNHVLSRSSYSTMDDYFEGEGIHVPGHWATLCRQAGFPVSAANVS